MKRFWWALLIAATGPFLPGCSREAPTPKSPAPILTLRINECLASPFMPSALAVTTGGSTKDGSAHKIECKFQVEYPQYPQKDETTRFSLRGMSIHIGDDKKLPEEQRNSFKLTADSESTISVSVVVECSAAIRVLLDGEEVAAPVEIIPGRHQLTITGRFKPGS